MKKLFILLLAISISVSYLSAQVFADFETPETTPVLISEGEKAVVDNPDNSGLNISKKVAYHNKIEGNWHYLGMEFPDKVQIYYNNTLTFKVHCSTKGRIFAKFWNNGSVLIEHWAPDYDFMPTENSWVVCEMDMTEAMNMEFDKLEIAACVDNELVADVYIDDFELSNPEAGDGSPKLIFSASSNNLKVGDEVNFDASQSFDFDGDIVDYTWNFGDGTTSSGVTATHTYSQKGNYIATITITDNDGKVSTDNVFIMVMGVYEKISELYFNTSNPETNKKVEAIFQLGDTYLNNYDSDELTIDAEITLPDGNVKLIPCFFYQKGYLMNANWKVDEGIKSWMLRFSSEQVGEHSIKIKLTDSEGEIFSESQSIQIAQADNKGIIRNDVNNNQYYRHQTGEPFYPMGINIGWDNIDNYTTIINNLSDNNANIFRYWHTPFAKQALEWSKNSFYQGLGQYNQAAAAMTDSLLDLCSARDMNMQLAIFQHGMFSENVNEMWEDNPYNSANGGFVERAEEYFYNDDCKHQTKKLLRYIVARWGYSTDLFAWEFFNEVQFSGIHNSQTQQWRDGVMSWHSEMSQYIETIDPFNHIQTTSADHKQLLVLDTITNLDVIQYHLYNDDLLDVLNSDDLHFRTELQNAAIINGEYGTNNEADVSFDMQRNAIWNGIMSQTPHYMWIWGHYTDANWANLFEMPVDFLSTEDLSTNKDLTTFEFEASKASVKLKALGLKTDKDIFGYIYSPDNSDNIEDAICSLTNIPYANYNITFFLPESGEVVYSENMSLIKLTNKIELPKFSKSIAFKIKYVSDYTLPIAIAGNDTLIGSGATVKFSALLSQSDNTLSYSWNLIEKPENSQLEVNNVENMELSVAPDVSGIYKLSLLVSDGSQTSIPDVVTITVSYPPVANAGDDIFVNAQTEYLDIDGSDSYDLDGDEITYLWEVISAPANSAGRLFYSTKSVARLKLDAVGSFIVTLTVNDGLNNSAVDTVSISYSSTGITIQKSNMFSVYPNPTKGSLIITNKTQEQIKSIQIFDITGSKLMSKSYSQMSGNIQLDIESYVKTLGNLILRIASDKSVVYKRIIYKN